VRTIEQAVSRLGARQLRALLVELSARRLFESRNAAIRELFHELWEHSLAVAQVARMLALRRRDVDADAAYLAGLLHDVGKPVSAALLLEAERVAAKQAAAWLASDAWLGVISECHREVGVAMARSWNLPDDLVLAIARSARYSNEGPGSITSVVCFANALVKRAGIYPGTFDLEKNDALVREGGDLYCMSEAAITALTSIIQDEEARRNTLPS
jgi:putative nucleotidyltransferase with HDIG domain